MKKMRPLLGCAAAWVAGSAAGYQRSGGPLVLLLAGVILLVAAWTAAKRIHWKEGAMLCVTLIVSAVYWDWNDAANVTSVPKALECSAEAAESKPVKVSGTIDSVVERDGDRVSFMLKLQTISTPGGPAHHAEGKRDTQHAAAGEKLAVQLKLAAEQEIETAAGWKRGDRLTMPGTLEQPGEARNFGGFDYRTYLHHHRIHWLLKAEGASTAVAEPFSGFGPTGLLRLADGARAGLANALDRLFEEPHAGYMKGLIIGIGDALDPQTYEDYSRLGLTHILAISGMHVAIFVGAMLFLFSRLRLTRETGLLLTLLLVPGYVLLSGAGPSVIRAGLMSMIGLYAARSGLLKDGLNLLSGSALLMLLWNPYYLLDVSFQLSYLVTAGLMVFVPPMDRLFTRLPRRIRGAAVVTLAAQLASFPLTIYYFNQFSLLSFPANLVLVPLITFIVLPLGTGALLVFSFWEKGGYLLAQGTEVINNATYTLIQWMNDWGHGVTIWRSPSPLWIGVYYLLLYGILAAAVRVKDARSQPVYGPDETVPLVPQAHAVGPSGRRERFALWRKNDAPEVNVPFKLHIISPLLCALMMVHLYHAYRPEAVPDGGRLSFLDVGQGDSILITTPGGARLLVDGGGTQHFGNKEAWRQRRDPYEVGRKLLVPLLKKRGIQRLDAVILTHGDRDHAGGLQAVLEQIPVTSLIFNGTMASGDDYSKLMRTALSRNVRLYGAYAGMNWSPDPGTTLRFMYPLEREAAPVPLTPLPMVKEQNDASVVFRLEMGGRNFLFTGDMEERAESELLDSLAVKGHPSARGMKPEIAGSGKGQPGAAAAREHLVDVLKVAHHGSKTSSIAPWLSYWHPAAAVISAGVNNTYGHPNPGVLERLEAEKTQIFRTDLQGEIQLEVEGGVIRARHKLGL